jgi:hypothetical protein
MAALALSPSREACAQLRPERHRAGGGATADACSTSTPTWLWHTQARSQYSCCETWGDGRCRVGRIFRGIPTMTSRLREEFGCLDEAASGRL